MKEPIEKYKNIINLPHHVSSKHPQMSLYERSAQFAPFSALTGYDEVIEEEGRLTNKKIELNEEAKNILDYKLQILKKNINKKPLAKITYFIPDQRKERGRICYGRGANFKNRYNKTFNNNGIEKGNLNKRYN